MTHPPLFFLPYSHSLSVSLVLHRCYDVLHYAIKLPLPFLYLNTLSLPPVQILMTQLSEAAAVPLRSLSPPCRLRAHIRSFYSQPTAAGRGTHSHTLLHASVFGVQGAQAHTHTYLDYRFQKDEDCFSLRLCQSPSYSRLGATHEPCGGLAHQLAPEVGCEGTVLCGI